MLDAETEESEPGWDCTDGRNGRSSRARATLNGLLPESGICSYRQEEVKQNVTLGDENLSAYSAPEHQHLCSGSEGRPHKAGLRVAVSRTS